jgi:hypothetical protein
MPYWAPSLKGAQCQAYSCAPLLRGSGWPAQPGISSFVRRGRSPGLTSLNFTSCIAGTGFENSRCSLASVFPKKSPCDKEFPQPGTIPYQDKK